MSRKAINSQPLSLQSIMQDLSYFSAPENDTAEPSQDAEVQKSVESSLEFIQVQRSLLRDSKDMDSVGERVEKIKEQANDLARGLA